MAEDTPSTKPTAELVWFPPDPNDPAVKPRRLFFQFRGNTPGQKYILGFGDGTTVAGTGSNAYDHTFATSGIYLSTARDLITGRPIRSRAPVVVRDGYEPAVKIEPKSAEDYLTHVITFPTDETIFPTLWRITLADGVDPEEVWVRPGEAIERILDEGTWDVLVEDIHGQQNTTVHVVVDSPYDPNWESARRVDVDPTGMTLGVKYRKVTSKPVLINWGDGSAEQEVANPTVGAITDHKYAKSGNFLTTMKYKDGTGKPLKQPVKVPWT